MTYFDGFISGAHAVVQDWYKDGLVYINIQQFNGGTALSRPTSEKSFLVSFDRPEKMRSNLHSLITALMITGEKRNADGTLAVISCNLPQI